jgi:hypothetical protein
LQKVTADIVEVSSLVDRSVRAAALLSIDLATLSFVLLVRKYEKRKVTEEETPQDEEIVFQRSNGEQQLYSTSRDGASTEITPSVEPNLSSDQEV